MKTAILISTLIAFSFSIARANPVVTDSKSAVAKTEEEKKKRVKKKPSQTKTKQTDSDDAAYTSEPEEETDFWAACLGSLCGSVFGSMCGSNGSDESSYEEESFISAVDGVSAHENDTGLNYSQGIIEPANITKSSVELWDKPGGYEADGFVLGNLQRSTEVTVIRFVNFNITQWALVTSNEPGSVEGWVLERDVAPIRELGADGRTEEEQAEYPTDQIEPGASAISSDFVRGRPKFIFLAEFSLPLFTNSSLYNEYNSNEDSTKFMYRFGAEVGYFLSKTVNISFSFGYLNADGIPQYDYEASGLLDSPQDSKLRIWNYGLQFGQLFFFGKEMFFSYGIAPTVFNVNMSSRILEYENDILVGERTDELSRWKVGGEVNVKIGATVAKKVPFSLSVRYSLIPWESYEEKSLTLDYMESNSISIFSFGFSVGYIFF